MQKITDHQSVKYGLIAMASILIFNLISILRSKNENQSSNVKDQLCGYVTSASLLLNIL